MHYVSNTDLTAIWPDDLPLPDGVIDGERRFEIETVGPWSIVRKVRGLAVAKSDLGVMVHGDRSLDHAVQSGYQMEGRVSVAGKTRRAFTSSQLFIHKGELINMAILYVV